MTKANLDLLGEMEELPFHGPLVLFPAALRLIN
jgi:hypothetical protein